jgi:hypothetical protein
MKRVELFPPADTMVLPMTVRDIKKKKEDGRFHYTVNFLFIVATGKNYQCMKTFGGFDSTVNYR